MTPVDRWIQRWRISKVRHFIPTGARVLDVGCHEGELFRQLADRIGDSVGVDSLLEEPISGPGYRLLPGAFPDGLPADGKPFDAITLLAVFGLERIPQVSHVPTILELVKPEDRAAVDFMASGTPISRSLAVGPRVPSDRVAALRNAMEATLKDQAFLAEAKKRRLPLRPRKW